MVGDIGYPSVVLSYMVFVSVYSLLLLKVHIVRISGVFLANANFCVICQLALRSACMYKHSATFPERQFLEWLHISGNFVYS